MKKGFTLIELLAVIVILAIIALIATPIILGIINDAREESNKRSVELYASAIKNGIAAHQLRTGNEVLPGTYDKDNKLPFGVEYDGKVECTSVIISETGKVSLDKCTVNGGTKEYSYGIEQSEPSDKEDVLDSGSKQVHKPQYYTTLEYDNEDAPTNPSTEPPTGQYVYIGYDVDINNKISASYVCLKREENGSEYCLKGGDDGAAYDTNITVLEDAFGESACSVNDDNSFGCSADGLYVDASPTGMVYASDDVAECIVTYSYTAFGCFLR